MYTITVGINSSKFGRTLSRELSDSCEKNSANLMAWKYTGNMDDSPVEVSEGSEAVGYSYN